jgi:hypothetical protein
MAAGRLAEQTDGTGLDDRAIAMIAGLNAARQFGLALLAD